MIKGWHDSPRTLNYLKGFEMSKSVEQLLYGSVLVSVLVALVCPRNPSTNGSVRSLLNMLNRKVSVSGSPRAAVRWTYIYNAVQYRARVKKCGQTSSSPCSTAVILAAITSLLCTLS